MQKGDREETLEPTAEALQKKIDEIGFGPAQIIAVTCCGGIMASEGSEVNIMGCMTTLLAEQWNLSPFMKGFMTSIVFVGFAIGNLFSGYVGDRYGRRPAILISYFVIFVAGTLTSFTEACWSLVCIRFFVGVGCGIGFPSVYSLVPEVTPVWLRGVKSAVLISFMPLGEFYASLGVFLIDKELEGTTPLGVASWRTLVQWSSIPPLFFLVFSLAFLQESPHFLLSRGRYKELSETLDHMAWLNGMHVHTAVAPRAVETAGGPKDEVGEEVFSFLDAVYRLFSKRFMRTTLFLCLAQFTKDFGVFGLGYVFPQYFQETAGKLSVGSEMMVIALLALPGVVLAAALTKLHYVGHITSMSLTAALTGMSAFMLLDFIRCSVFAYFVKFFAMAYFIVVVVYTAEVFPTRIRNSAVGLCTGCGRLGSITSPLIFEILKSVTSSFSPWWLILLCLDAAVALGAPIFLTIETKGQKLADDEGDSKRIDAPEKTQYSTA